MATRMVASLVWPSRSSSPPCLLLAGSYQNVRSAIQLAGAAPDAAWRHPGIWPAWRQTRPASVPSLRPQSSTRRSHGTNLAMTRDALIDRPSLVAQRLDGVEAGGPRG